MVSFAALWGATGTVDWYAFTQPALLPFCSVGPVQARVLLTTTQCCVPGPPPQPTAICLPGDTGSSPGVLTPGFLGELGHVFWLAVFASARNAKMEFDSDADSGGCCDMSRGPRPSSTFDSHAGPESSPSNVNFLVLAKQKHAIA